MSSDAAMAMKVAIDAGASLDEMQRVLLKSVAPQDLFMAIRNAAAKERAGSGGIRADATSSNHHEASGGEAVRHHHAPDGPYGVRSHQLADRNNRSPPSKERSSYDQKQSGDGNGPSRAPATTSQSAEQLIPATGLDEYPVSAGNSSSSHNNNLNNTNLNNNLFAAYNTNSDTLKQLAEALGLPGSNAAKERQRSDSEGDSASATAVKSQNNIAPGWVGDAPPPDHLMHMMTPAKTSRPLSNKLPPFSASALPRPNSSSVRQPSTPAIPTAASMDGGGGGPSSSRPSSRTSSRPSSATTAENAELMNRLEMQAQKKAQLGTLVSQFASLLQQNDPIDTMKERLREMDKLQEAHATLELELDEAHARMAQVEDGAARQVRSVLDTNGKLQQELVQLSRDLTQAEQALAVEKKRNVEIEDSANGRIEDATQTAQQETHRAQNLLGELEQSRRDMESLIASKKAVVSRLQALTERAGKLQSENDDLSAQKSNISKHVWNLTDKLKKLSAELELATAKQAAAAAEIEEATSVHRQELEKRARKEGQVQSKLEAAEKAHMEADTNFQARLRTLQDAQEESTKARQQAEQRAESLSKDLVEAHELTMSLRREVARVTANGGSIQRELDQEREELVGLRTRATELEELALALRSKCEALENQARAAEDAAKKAREESQGLREDLRGEKKAREQIGTALKQARENLNRAHEARVTELAKLEATAAREAESYAAEIKARDAADEARKKDIEAEAREKATEWAAEYETDVQELRQVMEQKEITIASLEERALAAEQGLVEKTNEISNARMDAQKYQDASNAAGANAKKFEASLAQGEKAMHQMKSRLQVLEASKAELLGELRDRNDECIRLAAESKSDATESEDKRKKLVATIDQLTLEVQHGADNHRKISRKTEDVLQRATTAEERAQKAEDALKESQDQLRKKTLSMKTHVEEVGRFSSSVSSLRERNAELEKELQQEGVRLIQMRKKHHADMDALRESMAKERTDLERSLSDRSKVLEQRRANELAEMERDKARSVAEAEARLNGAVAEAMANTEKRAQRQMQDERKALREELGVIQTRYDEKVASLEDCIRGLTGEASMHVKRGQELVEELERERNNVRQLRDREHLNSVQTSSLSADVQRLKKDLRSAEERHYNEHSEAIERLTADLESQRQRHQKAQKEVEAEEARAQELRRKLDDTEEAKNRMKLQVSDLERQVAAEKSGAQQKQERTLDEVERLERKVTAAREEKNDALKGGEKLRLRLRASEREKADLEHQLHVARSELEWSSRELEKSRIQPHVSATNKLSGGGVGVGGTTKESMAVGGGRDSIPPYAVGAVPTAGEVELLRRQNQDLLANVQDLTQAMKTLGGGGSSSGGGGHRKSKSREGRRSRGSSRGSNRGNSRGSSRGSIRSSLSGAAGLGPLEPLGAGEGMEPLSNTEKAGPVPFPGTANEDPRREKVRQALVKRRTRASERDKKVLKPETSPQQLRQHHHQQQLLPAQQQQQQVQQGKREYTTTSSFSPDEYDRGSVQQMTQAEQWKSRQQAAKAAGGAQFVSAREHYGRGGGEKSQILRRKQQQHLKAEQEILSPMGTTSKSSVARARRLARDDVHL